MSEPPFGLNLLIPPSSVRCQLLRSVCVFRVADSTSAENDPRFFIVQMTRW
jgi:hypothetical protein